MLATMFPRGWKKPDLKKAASIPVDRDTFMKEELNCTPVLGIVLYDP